MRDVIVIGCGIIGATVGLALKKQGRDVLILDDKRPLAGTGPSGGHLKPSWFSGMKKTEYEPAMELLDDVWGLKTEEFVLRPTPLTTTVYRVDTDQVLATEHQVATVTALEQLNNYPLVRWDGGEDRTRLLVVAAGVWCSELLKGLDITSKQGVSFRFTGQLKQPFIAPWAPYKQVVAHQQTADQIWVGDGSAILPENWTEERTQQCQDRCRSMLGLKFSYLNATMGLRPYCKTGNDPCLLKQIGPRCWVATGAGKSGTIGAGWAARRILCATN